MGYHRAMKDNVLQYTEWFLGRTPHLLALLRDQVDSVQISRMQDVPVIGDRLLSFAEQLDPPHKSCYATAGHVADEFSGCRIVLGFYMTEIPAAHAWNMLEGRHFDLLGEYRQLGATEYVSVGTLTRDEYAALQSDRSVIDPLTMYLRHQALTVA